MFVKICGITTEEDALLAVAMGANAVGFIFAPSTRQIAPTRASDIAKRLPPEIITFGVFRNESRERVVNIVNRHGIGAAQLHGFESPEDTLWVRERVPRLMKAFVGGSDEVLRAAEWGEDPILLDASTPGAGVPFDWSLARLAPRDMRMVLAGGLNPDTVGDAIRQVRPWGVDVSSGVEKSPGRKDAVKVKQFIRNAREAQANLAPEEPLVPGGDFTVAPYDWRLDD